MILDTLSRAVRELRGYTTQTTLENLNQMYDSYIGGGVSTSGVSVNTKTALGHSPVWRAVNLISGDCGRLKMDVFRRLDPRGKERDKAHPAWWALARRPNPWQTPMGFRQFVTGQAVLGGNGYAFILRMGRDVVLVPLDNTQVEVKIDEKTNLPKYHVTAEGQRKEYDPTDILHIRGFSDDGGLTGMKLVDVLKNAIGPGIAARDFGSRYFKNSATPSMTIIFPHGVETDALNEFEDHLRKKHGGVDNAHKFLLLNNGANVIERGHKAREAQLLELRRFDLLEVANAFGIPPSKLGSEINTSYASLEAEGQRYLDECLDHWLRAWEDECWLKLLTAEEQRADSHVIEFNRNQIVQIRFTERMQGYKTAVEGSWMSPNDVLDKENMNPIEGGDFYQRQLNMTTFGPDSQEQAAQVTLNELSLAIERLLRAGDLAGVNLLRQELAELVGAGALPELTPEDLAAAVAAGQAAPADDVQLDGDTKPKNGSNANDGRSATRVLVADLARRMSRRLARQAEGRAKAGGDKLFEWAEAIHEHAGNVTTMTEMAEPLAVFCRQCGPCTWTAAQAAECVLLVARDEYLQACDVTEGAIRASTAEAARRFEAAAPVALSRLVFGGE